MDNTKKTSLKHTLLKFSLVPVLVLGLVLTFISTRTLVHVATGAGWLVKHPPR